MMAYLLSFPGCCWISSRRYFLANNINPFIGRLGLSGSFSFFLAGEVGGDMAWWFLIPPGIATGLWMDERLGWDPDSVVESVVAVAVVLVVDTENSNIRNLSHKSGVRTTSWWSGGKHTSPIDSSLHGIPYFSKVKRGWTELQPGK